MTETNSCSSLYLFFALALSLSETLGWLCSKVVGIFLSLFFMLWSLDWCWISDYVFGAEDLTKLLRKEDVDVDDGKAEDWEVKLRPCLNLAAPSPKLIMPPPLPGEVRCHRPHSASLFLIPGPMPTSKNSQSSSSREIGVGFFMPEASIKDDSPNLKTTRISELCKMWKLTSIEGAVREDPKPWD